jgi:RimJ/RimL family protein N-acetyltransferase
MKILDTERLTLRTLDADDAPFYLELVNQPSFLKFIGDKGVRTVEAARQAIADGPQAMQRERGHSLYLVQRRSDGAPLGMCGLIKRDSLPGVDIGYALMPEFWGQGYAHEAAAAVLAHGRDSVGLDRLMAITSPQNQSSIGLLLKLGLRFVEFTHLPPDQRPTNIYQIDFARAVA